MKSLPAVKCILAVVVVFSPMAVSHAAKSKKASNDPFLYKSTAPLSVSAVLAHFEIYDRRLNSLSAGFRQSLIMETTGITSDIKGTVAYRKPERLRIEHEKPERQTIVADGQDIWIHRHRLAQVIQAAIVDWKDADPMMNNLLQFGSYGKMLKAYDVRLDTAAAGPVLLLRPKRGDSGADFTLRFVLDERTLFPVVTELIVGAMRVRTEFDEVRFNPEIDAKQFIFTIPKGADVFRNFKPPKFER
ncbi:MAG: outer-membrane lipoprotein carrier protein LolA [Elusimicrobiota bacterium]